MYGYSALYYHCKLTDKGGCNIRVSTYERYCDGYSRNVLFFGSLVNTRFIFAKCKLSVLY